MSDTSTTSENIQIGLPTHPWLHRIRVAFVPGSTSIPMLKDVADNLLRHFRLLGHQVQTTPDDHTDVLLTTAPFGEPLDWRRSLLVTARRRFGLSHQPTLYTLVQISPEQFDRMLDHFRVALAKEPHIPEDFTFPGLAPSAHRVLIEQGLRGGPILSLLRMVQTQAKGIRIILVVGDDHPQAAYHFDLVGAYPRSDTEDLESFYEDIVLRTVTTVSTREVTQHETVGEPVPRALWDSLSVPVAMRAAGQQLGKRHFFTEMIRVSDLSQVPAVKDAVASQYSEGCFATWDPVLGALVATVTGSARPVDKGSLTDDDLAVITGVSSDISGALVRQVEGHRNAPPSSEAVEMMDMDSLLPTITREVLGAGSVEVPVIRSKLHGHRGVLAYDPRYVEYVPLDEPYYHYLASCATEAQARGIKTAFARSEALNNPDDPRQVVFTVLPGHGAVIVEKWVPQTAPLQIVWEYIDTEYLQIAKRIPQGPMEYAPNPDGLMHLRIPDGSLTTDEAVSR